MPYADLELTLRAAADGYTVDARFRAPGAPVDYDLACDAPAPIDPAALGALVLDTRAYGQALSEQLFSDPAMRRAWAEVKGQLSGASVPLRLRLRFERGAQPLHGLRWELVEDPDRGAGDPLALSERILLSRYLAGEELAPVDLRPRTALRALVAVANPDLRRTNLAPIDVEGEVRRAVAELGTIPAAVLASGREGARVTMDALAAAIRDGPDILYLAAHGTIVDGEPYLFLEHEDGSVDRASAGTLAQRLRDMARRPVLVVLASCQSAGVGLGGGDALVALGPRLAGAGVPAVIAMQGNVGMPTVAALMPRLFAELQRHGEVDRALAAARLAALKQEDWWMPALFMRLRDGCIWAEERAVGDERFDVRGLPSPYLGGQGYDYAQRERYAGREREVEAAVHMLATPGAQRSLLFVTGPVGSGKSSFAMAGLLPALEAHYHDNQYATRWERMYPGGYPLAALAESLRQLGVPVDGPFAAAASALVGAQPASPPPDTIAILVVDQLEELFTRAEPAERDAFFMLLAGLPAFPRLRMHVIATMRSDFLPELFAYQTLYDEAKRGLDLRAMSVERLQAAILRPLEQTHAHKRFEPALLDRLAADAARSASYLPLLQMTLDDLWRRGSLRLAAYSTLTNAVTRRAEEVWQFIDYDGAHAEPRAEDDRQLILNICADLVDAGDVPERDLLRPRELNELVHDDAGHVDARRDRLIDDLCSARLLSKSVESRAGREIEVVSLIHETLLRNWSRLQSEIEHTRVAQQRRGRFRQALAAWRDSGQQEAYLLDPIPLAEAEALAQARDVELRGPEARAFLQTSLRRRDRRLRRARIVTVVMTCLAVAALALAVVAVRLRGQAEASATEAHDQARRAAAQALAAQADAAGQRLPQRALLLAIEAYQSLNTVDDPLPITEDALRTALERLDGIGLGGHARRVHAVALSADGRTLVTASADGTARVWDLAAADPAATPRVLRGHAEPVRAAALSVDGRTLVTSSEDDSVRAWDMSAADPSQAVRILLGHAADVEHLALSTDGATLITGSDDTTAIVWRLSDPDPSSTAVRLAGHADDVEAVALSPDGRHAATGSDDGTVGLWDLAAPDPSATLSQLTGGGKPFSAVRFSPDSRRVLAASEDGSVRIWRLDQLGEAPVVLVGQGPIIDIALDADGLTLAAASADRVALVWSLAGDNPATSRRVLLGHSEALTALALSADGTLLATSGADGTLRVWDLTDPDPSRGQRVLVGHDGAVLGVTMRTDKRLLVSGGEDGMARVWSLDGEGNSGAARLLDAGAGAVAAIALSSDGRTLASGGDDGAVRLWNLAAPGEPPRALRGHNGAVTAAAISADGGTLATAGADDTARVWRLGDLAAAPLLLRGHTDRINDLLLSPDGRLLITVSQDDTARVWDLAAADPAASARILRGHTNNVWEVLLSPDGHTVITGSEDNTVRLWDLNVADVSGRSRILSGHTGDILALTLGANGRTLLSASEDGTARVWELGAPGAERAVATLDSNSGQVRSLALTPDGRHAMTGGEDGLIRLWDLAAPTARPRLLIGHEGPVTRLRISADGRTLISASDDATARVWDLTAANPSASSRVMRGHSEPLSDILLTPDGARLVTASADGTARVWPFDIGPLLPGACRALGRNLSQAEWEQYFSVAPYRRTCPGLPPGVGVAEGDAPAGASR